MKEALRNAKWSKTLSNNNSWAEEGHRKSPKIKHSNRKGALWKPLWEEQSTTKCWKEQQNQKEAFRMKGEMLNRGEKNKLGNNNSWAEEGQRKSPRNESFKS